MSDFVNDAPYTVYRGKIVCPYYRMWHAMRRRCRSDYEGCIVCPAWHSFMEFRQWADTQGNVEGLELDKDILADNYPGKLYSPSTCCFIPKLLNCLLNRNGTHSRRKSGGVYRVRVRTINGRKHIGDFHTLEEAQQAYAEFKANYVRSVADEIPLTVRVRKALESHLERMSSHVPTN